VGLSVPYQQNQPALTCRATGYQESSYRGPNYDGVRFGPSVVLPGSVVGHYHQQAELIWAEFGGERVRTGRLVGVCDNHGVIEAAYCQIMGDGEVVAGRCVSTPTVLPDGRLRLTERWHRADGSSGVSYIDELPRQPVGVAGDASVTGHQNVTEGVSS
jgi:hypothetical protein